VLSLVISSGEHLLKAGLHNEEEFFISSKKLLPPAQSSMAG
jgi:hypothetical protein